MCSKLLLAVPNHIFCRIALPKTVTIAMQNGVNLLLGN